jgi:hypothetical protein
MICLRMISPPSGTKVMPTPRPQFLVQRRDENVAFNAKKKTVIHPSYQSKQQLKTISYRRNIFKLETHRRGAF